MLWVVYWGLFKAVSIPICQFMSLIWLLLIYAKKHLSTYAPREWYLTDYAHFHYWTIFGSHALSSFFFIVVQFMKTMNYQLSVWEPFANVMTAFMRLGITFTYIGLVSQCFLLIGLPRFYKYRNALMHISVGILCTMLVLPFSQLDITDPKTVKWVIGWLGVGSHWIAWIYMLGGMEYLDDYNLDDDEYPSALWMYKPRIGFFSAWYTCFLVCQEGLSEKYPEAFTIIFGIPAPLLAFYFLRTVLAWQFRTPRCRIPTGMDLYRPTNTPITRYRRNYERYVMHSV